MFLNGNPLWNGDLMLEDRNFAVYDPSGLLGICKGYLISKVLK